MGALWARRQKAANGTAAKRRRTEEEAYLPGSAEEQGAASNGASLSAGSAKPSGVEPDDEAERNANGRQSGATIGDKNDSHSDTITKSIEQIGASSDAGVEAGHKRSSDSDSASLPTADAMRRPRPLNDISTRGPSSAAHIRVSTAVDFQRDVCKQYKLKGTCSYGDSCKFLHERDDHAAGRKIEREWELAARNRPARGRSRDAPPGPAASACSICRTDPPELAVKPACGHVCCELCFAKASKRAAAKCLVCHKLLGHTAERAA